MQKFFVLSLLWVVGCFSSLSAEVKKIVVWHSLEGFTAEKFAYYVDRFNSVSPEYRVVLEYKGGYEKTFQSGVKAALAGHPPHLLQLNEAAVAEMFSRPELFVPFDEVMGKFSKGYSPDEFIDTVRLFYATKEGSIACFPWTLSVPMLYYNKELFQKVGLDPEKAPQTWEEVEACGKVLAKHGYKGFSTTWPTAYHLEHYAAVHNLPIASLKNGFDGKEARLNFNTKPIIAHIARLAEWQKEGIFCYGGRDHSAARLFIEGRVGMFLQGCGRLETLKRKVKFQIGVAPYPYSKEVIEKPYQVNSGGSSLWIMTGFTDDEYKGVAEFLSYLASPNRKSEWYTATGYFWHKETGYLPTTKTAYQVAEAEDFYKENEASKLAVQELFTKRIGDFTSGVRLPYFTQIRNIILDELELALAGKVSAEEALNQAILKGNKLLEAYEKGATAIAEAPIVKEEDAPAAPVATES